MNNAYELSCTSCCGDMLCSQMLVLKVNHNLSGTPHASGGLWPMLEV